MDEVIVGRVDRTRLGAAMRTALVDAITTAEDFVLPTLVTVLEPADFAHGPVESTRFSWTPSDLGAYYLALNTFDDGGAAHSLSVSPGARPSNSMGLAMNRPWHLPVPLSRRRPEPVRASERGARRPEPPRASVVRVPKPKATSGRNFDVVTDDRRVQGRAS